MDKKIEKEEKLNILRGEIYMMDLSPVVQSEQGGIRPCVVIQNNFGNRFSPNITIIPLTSVLSKKPLPTHIQIEGGKFGLKKKSVVMCESIRTISKKRVREYIGTVDTNTMIKIENGVLINLGILI